MAQVCTEEGKTAEGIQGQKRLILDHAAKMYADLNSKKLVLETGYSLEGNSEVIPCKVRNPINITRRATSRASYFLIRRV